MKIGINTFGCDHGQSGIGAYILSLVNNLPKTEHRIQLFGNEFDKYTYTSGVDNVGYACVPISETDLAEKTWFTFSFNMFAKKQKYDAVLFPAGFKSVPVTFDLPCILVIQNTIPKSNNYLNSLLFRRILKAAHGVITPSRYICDELLSLGADERKIQVIHNGIDTSLFYPRHLEHEEALLIKPFAIRRPYIIYASRIKYPEKCHAELITAFGIFKKKTGAPHRLVIAGADGEGSAQVHQAVLRSPVASDILLTGYFPHQNLPQLYSAADLCVFPSAIEGVGLPVIEAMACGIPTASARAGALPEIAGNATFYFNQKDPDDIAQAIEQLVYDPSGKNDARRNELIRQGLSWAQQYSWEKTAADTLAYISRCLKA